MYLYSLINLNRFFQGNCQFINITNVYKETLFQTPFYDTYNLTMKLKKNV